MIKEIVMKLKHIIINIGITSFLVLFIMWILPKILSEFVDKDILSYIVGVLFIPSLLIFSFFKGLWGAMHNVSFKIHLGVSFIFYSAVIALMQIFIYKQRKKEKHNK
jgi:hypothetical protein